MDKIKGKIDVQFKSWRKSYILDLVESDRIMIGFKLFKIHIKVVDKDDDSMKVSVNNQSVSNTSGSFLANALGKMKV